MTASILALTTTHLLRQLRPEHANEIWREFDARYRPVLVGVARRLGLTLADAEDVAQEALVQFVRHYDEGRFDRERGRVRSLILSIVRNRATDALRERAARRERRGQSAMVSVPQEEELSALWDEQCRKAVVERAMIVLRQRTRLEERTIRAFELVAIRGRPVAEVAQELGLSADSVYAARNRCTRQLRAIVDEISDLYAME